MQQSVSDPCFISFFLHILQVPEINLTGYGTKLLYVAGFSLLLIVLHRVVLITILISLSVLIKISLALEYFLFNINFYISLSNSTKSSLLGVFIGIALNLLFNLVNWCLYNTELSHPATRYISPFLLVLYEASIFSSPRLYISI